MNLNLKQLHDKVGTLPVNWRQILESKGSSISENQELPVTISLFGFFSINCYKYTLLWIFGTSAPFYIYCLDWIPTRLEACFSEVVYIRLKDKASNGQTFTTNIILDMFKIRGQITQSIKWWAFTTDIFLGILLIHYFCSYAISNWVK